ncbi:tannase/feruloyl esterase family alpha/beta hydrolase [Sphingobium sp. YR768]|jgi:feruloyl esterase|uniref:tannase/feruloyl esterase family alpha/beta hydrolase n=1 Tax=Sphingobium sp. YR768 TaxID=1884365 RepID=UPI0008B4B493|nr:tannase/feruloyl esterase family alpha/beta hydrolase [Sphingobium sp. YR768]SER29517.1 feruloyl esterase [Sphingobium sp. YR768]
MSKIIRLASIAVATLSPLGFGNMTGIAAYAAPASPERSPMKSLPSCDDGLKALFRPDDETRIVQVAYIKKGSPLILEASTQPDIPIATANICMVKLLVGPGNPGPADAPSTSDGIGIEVWLPDSGNWNDRLHALGGGGWQGGPAAQPGAIASLQAAEVAMREGAVSSTTDTGHNVMSGSFAMLPDGSINSRLWNDFSSRAIHQQAVKSKALAALYYGKNPRYAYWDGGSTGGRQGLNLAQNHPDDFDGIIAMYPAINWTRFITSELYPQIVIQRDLGGHALDKQKLDRVSNAAISACDTVGGQHLGYIIDPVRCHYDPTRDASVICVDQGGKAPVPTCLTVAEARAVNKIWYGMTSDGSAPDPSIDNGWHPDPQKLAALSQPRRWFGPARGTKLYLDYPGFEGLANPDHPFSIATHVVALEMQDATIAEPNFQNLTANGQSKWKNLTFAQLSHAFDRGIALQSAFGNINTDNPDLSAFRKRGGKLLTWHGMADEVIAAQGTVHYYQSVAEELGGIDQIRAFWRLFLVPGLGHGTPNGTANSKAVVPNFAEGQFYSALTEWTEKAGKPPAQMVLEAGDGASARQMPICSFPQTISYVKGDPKAAASYRCSGSGGASANSR